MRKVVLGEQDLPFVLELLPDQLRDPELLPQPHRHRLGEGTEPSWKCRQIGREEPLELQERLVVEPHVVQILRFDLPRLETVLDGLMGEPLIVLLPCEAFLGGRCHQASILNEAGGGVMIETGNTQNVHASASFRIVSDTRPSFPVSAPSRPRRSPAMQARALDPCGKASCAMRWGPVRPRTAGREE